MLCAASITFRTPHNSAGCWWRTLLVACRRRLPYHRVVLLLLLYLELLPHLPVYPPSVFHEGYQERSSPARSRRSAPVSMLCRALLLLCLGSAACFSPAAMRPSLATARLSPFCSRAAAPCAQAAVPDSPEEAPQPASLADNLDAVYRFSRPHTIRGTLLACFTGVGRALVESPSFIPLLPSLFPRAMLGVLALLLGNLFIVGINQIYDVRPGVSHAHCIYLPGPRCPRLAPSPRCPAEPLARLARRWRLTRSTSRSSPWPPAASRRGSLGRSSSARVRRALRWSRQPSALSSSGSISSAPPSVGCTRCRLSRRAPPPHSSACLPPPPPAQPWRAVRCAARPLPTGSHTY